MLQNHANKLAADLHQHREDTTTTLTFSLDFEKHGQTLLNNQDPNHRRSFNAIGESKSSFLQSSLAPSPPQRMILYAAGKIKSVVEQNQQSNNQLNHIVTTTTHTTIGSIKGTSNGTTSPTQNLSTPSINNHQPYPVQYSVAFSNHRSIHTVANQRTNYEFGIQVPSDPTRPFYQASGSSPFGLTTPRGGASFFPSAMNRRHQVFTTSTALPQATNHQLQQQQQPTMYPTQKNASGNFQNGNGGNVGLPHGGAYPLSWMMQHSGVSMTHGTHASESPTRTTNSNNSHLETSGPILFPYKNQST
jgi:hypothetical protein